MSKLSDSPLKCKNRDLDKCKVETSCPEKGKCCLFCRKVWTCYLCCPKVMSYLSVYKTNPSKFTRKEREQIEQIMREVDIREIGNPARRKGKNEST